MANANSVAAEVAEMVADRSVRAEGSEVVVSVSGAVGCTSAAFREFQGRCMDAAMALGAAFRWGSVAGADYRSGAARGEIQTIRMQVLA